MIDKGMCWGVAALRFVREYHDMFVFAHDVKNDLLLIDKMQSYIEEHGVPCELHHGWDKIALIPNGADFVIKFNITGRDCWNSSCACEEEVDVYDTMIKPNHDERYFVPLEEVTTVLGFRIYVQERVEPNETDDDIYKIFTPEEIDTIGIYFDDENPANIAQTRDGRWVIFDYAI